MTHRSSSFSLARPAAMGLAAFALFLLVLSPGLVFDRAEAAPYPQGGTPTPGIVRPVGFAGGVFSCDGWTVTIPEGIVSDGGYIHCGGFNPNLAPAPPAGYSLRRHTINVNIYDHNNQWITFFGKPLNFCYTYGDSDLAA